MAKNISVVDAQGNILEATYPKRAKGLVKKGRARFIDRFTICLAGPPLSMEDNAMSFINKMKAETDAIRTAADELESAGPEKLDSAYLIRKIDQILTDSGYLHTALQQLEHLDAYGARTAADIIAEREHTNRRMIDFLEKLMGKLAV